jgi:stearoyl-CoA desaturase (delta-9 desaturase)
VKAPARTKKIQKGILFFFFVTLTTSFIGVPYYLGSHSLAAWEWALFLFYIGATGMSITMGYHRLFAHGTYKAHPGIQFLLLFFGAAAFEQSALKWASQHRDHHTFPDTEKDPYSITRGFWHAHMGWLIADVRNPDYDNVKDLQKNGMVAHQHRFYPLWAFTAGILTPLLIGALTGKLLTAFIFWVCLRIVIVHQSTFCINSICHFIGGATYDVSSTARDHWLVALVTFGEGYHNFHHRFPSDYRNGVLWYHWDPSKWIIGFLSKWNLTSDLKTAPYFRILHARITAENHQAQSWLQQKMSSPGFIHMKRALEIKFERLQLALKRFEAAQMNYRNNRAAVQSKVQKFDKLRREQQRFRQIYESWLELTSRGALAA